MTLYSSFEEEEPMDVDTSLAVSKTPLPLARTLPTRQYQQNQLHEPAKETTITVVHNTSAHKSEVNQVSSNAHKSAGADDYSFFMQPAAIEPPSEQSVKTLPPAYSMAANADAKVLQPVQSIVSRTFVKHTVSAAVTAAYGNFDVEEIAIESFKASSNMGMSASTAAASISHSEVVQLSVQPVDDFAATSVAKSQKQIGDVTFERAASPTSIGNTSSNNSSAFPPPPPLSQLNDEWEMHRNASPKKISKRRQSHLTSPTAAIQNECSNQPSQHQPVQPVQRSAVASAIDLLSSPSLSQSTTKTTLPQFTTIQSSAAVKPTATAESGVFSSSAASSTLSFASAEQNQFARQLDEGDTFNCKMVSADQQQQQQQHQQQRKSPYADLLQAFKPDHSRVNKVDRRSTDLLDFSDDCPVPLNDADTDSANGQANVTTSNQHSDSLLFDSIFTNDKDFQSFLDVLEKKEGNTVKNSPKYSEFARKSLYIQFDPITQSKSLSPEKIKRLSLIRDKQEAIKIFLGEITEENENATALNTTGNAAACASINNTINETLVDIEPLVEQRRFSDSCPPARKDKEEEAAEEREGEERADSSECIASNDCNDNTAATTTTTTTTTRTMATLDGEQIVDDVQSDEQPDVQQQQQQRQQQKPHLQSRKDSLSDETSSHHSAVSDLDKMMRSSQQRHHDAFSDSPAFKLTLDEYDDLENPLSNEHLEKAGTDLLSDMDLSSKPHFHTPSAPFSMTTTPTTSRSDTAESSKPSHTAMPPPPLPQQQQQQQQQHHMAHVEKKSSNSMIQTGVSLSTSTATSVTAISDDDCSIVSNTTNQQLQQQLSKLMSELSAMKDKERAHLSQISSLEEENEKFKTVAVEFERIFHNLIKDNDESESKLNNEIIELTKERDHLQEDVSGLERAFDDLHRRFEKLKTKVEEFKRNEETLQRAVETYKQQLDKEKLKYSTLKKHAEEKLEQANSEIEKLRKTTTIELQTLKAELRKAEIKISSLELSGQQKEQENSQLTSLLEDLLNKVKPNN